VQQDSSFRLEFQTPLLYGALQKLMLSHCKSDPVAKFWCARNFCWKIRHADGEPTL